MKVPVSVPDNLNEITLEQFQEFLTIEEPTEKDVLRVFLGLSKNIIDKVPRKQVTSVSGQIMKMVQESKPKFINKFEYNGKKWGFIPNLDEMSSGEYDDATGYFPRSEEVDEKIVYHYEDAHRCMAVLFRPITLEKKGKYLIEEYEGSDKYAEELKGMPLSVVLGSMVFFYDLLNELLIAIPSFIQREMEKDHGSLTNGGNTTDTIRFARVTLEELKRLQRYPYTLAS